MISKEDNLDVRKTLGPKIARSVSRATDDYDNDTDKSVSDSDYKTIMLHYATKERKGAIAKAIDAQLGRKKARLIKKK